MSDYLEAEQRIIMSNVREYFTPHQPIQDVDLFRGRKKEIESVIQQLNTPGQHSLLFGERGVGKSSLANIASETLCVLTNDKCIRKRCDSDDSFPTVVDKLLREAGIDIYVQQSSHSKSEALSGGASAGLFSARGEKKDGDTVQRDGYFERANSPSWVVEQVKDIDALFLIDEVDVLRDDVQQKIAELVKQLSDEGSKLKCLLVGIAETAADLIGYHPSVQRCLKETHLKKMSDSEIAELVSTASTMCHTVFSPAAIRQIVKVSSGYPYFAHLLGLKSAEIVIGQGQSQVSLGHISDAIESATGDAEGILRTQYDEVVRSANTDEFRKVLVAAAAVLDDEISAKVLRSSYEEVWMESVSQGKINNYLRRIVSDDGSAILRRLAKGVYKFSDPRMRSYIRLVNMGDFGPGEE